MRKGMIFLLVAVLCLSVLAASAENSLNERLKNSIEEALVGASTEDLQYFHEVIRKHLFARGINPDASPTPKPQWDHPGFTVDVECTAVEKDSSNIYSTFLNLVLTFQNNTIYTIDAMDFSMFLYDAYGDMMSAYGVGASHESAFTVTNFKLGPGETYQTRVAVPGFNTARAGRVWVLRYHTLDGQTIAVPREDIHKVKDLAERYAF